MKDLQLIRSERLAVLETTFPAARCNQFIMLAMPTVTPGVYVRLVPQVHWIVLLLLGSSVLVTFLFESDQAVLRFLAMPQLRVFFTMLCGTLAAGRERAAEQVALAHFDQRYDLPRALASRIQMFRIVEPEWHRAALAAARRIDRDLTFALAAQVAAT